MGYFIALLMKKWFRWLLIVILLLVVSVYIFIPSKLVLSSSFVLLNSPAAVSRGLLDDSKWPVWWPIEDSPARNTRIASNEFHLDRNKYLVAEKLYRGLEIQVESPHTQTNSKLYLIPLPVDSVAVKWQCPIKTSLNPVTRFMQYREALVLKQDMDLIMNNLNSFFQKTENIYNISIQRTMVVDTVLVASKILTNHYPTVAEIYNLVKAIRAYVLQQHGVETNPPMLNVTVVDSTHFETMAAIPVNRLLPEIRGFYQKKLPRGYLLTTQVRGGNASIQEALKELRNYISDYQKTAMAIPFQSLITERISERDTSKWVTGLYFPIMR